MGDVPTVLAVVLPVTAVVFAIVMALHGEDTRKMPAVLPHAAWLGNRSRPWEAAEWGALPMDADGLAFRLPRFLSVAECEHIIQDLVPIAGFHMQSQDRLHKSTPLVGANLLEPPSTARHRDALNWSRNTSEGPDEVLASIERRIAALTAIPFHDDESPIMLGVTSTGSELTEAELMEHNANPDRFVRGLHHDHNQRSRRTATIIMYLTAQENGLVGGGTYFPCLRPVNAGGSQRGGDSSPGGGTGSVTRPTFCAQSAARTHSNASLYPFWPSD